MAKTIIGSFDGYHAAREVVRGLIDEGFMSSDISILASRFAREYRPDNNAKAVDATSNTTIDAMTGGSTGGAAGLAASPRSLANSGIGPIIAAGPLFAAVSGAGASASVGAMIAALTGVGVPEVHASCFVESVRRGGTLVTVRADESRAERAAEIMEDNGAIDLDQRVSLWRGNGRNGSDPSAAPCTLEQGERERRSYDLADPLSGLPPIPQEGCDSRDGGIRG